MKAAWQIRFRVKGGPLCGSLVTVSGDDPDSFPAALEAAKRHFPVLGRIGPQPATVVPIGAEEGS